MAREIQYLYTAEVMLIFDEGLEYHMTADIDTVVSKAEFLMDTYNFTTVDAIDDKTGEILFTINEY